MKAAVCREFGQPLVIEDVELATPESSEVKVDLKACAICHSDIIYMDGGWGGQLPAVFGHEASGVISEVGADVNNLAVGDSVVVTLVRYCGSCYFCGRGEQVMCENDFARDNKSPLKDAHGHSITQALRSGAFAEQVVVDASQVCKIPDELAFECASLLACGVLTGVGAVTNTAAVPPGSNVVVIGTGGVGLNCVQGACISQAKKIIAIDIEPTKLETALLFGATHALTATSKELVAEVKKLTDGRGADYVFVSVGARTPIEQSVSLLALGGSVVVVGMPPSGVNAEYDPGELAGNSQRIIGSKMGSARIAQDIPRLAQLYQSAQLKLDELITERYSLDQINLAIAASRTGQAIRNVIVMD